VDARKFPHKMLGTSRPEPVFNVYAAFDDELVEQVTLAEARQMKRDGIAYAINSGRDLRLVPTLTQEIDRRSQKGSMHEWETVHASELCIEQKRAFGSRFLRVTTLQYQPSHA
jgi:hypothetical protein